MGSLSIGAGDLNPALPRSSRASFNAGAIPSSVRSSAALTGHRPSLPALYNSSLPTHQEAGWNPHYFRSSFSGASNPQNSAASANGSPSALELSAAAAYGGPGYDYRRDSGYGPSPPIVTNSESRRGSYAAQVPTTTGLNNLRRTQSAWHIHDALANVPQIRHSSFSYAAQPGALGAGLNGVSASSYGMVNGGVHPGYASQMSYHTGNPHQMSLDGMGNGMFGGGYLLSQQQQQQLLVEARRQSAHRHNLDAVGHNGMNGMGQYPGYSMHHPSYSGNMSMPHMSGPPPAPHHHRQVSHKGSFDSGRVQRSAILEDFRSNKHRRWELKVSLAIFPPLSYKILIPNASRTWLDTSWSLPVIN